VRQATGGLGVIGSRRSTATRKRSVGGRRLSPREGRQSTCRWREPVERCSHHARKPREGRHSAPDSVAAYRGLNTAPERIAFHRRTPMARGLSPLAGLGLRGVRCVFDPFPGKDEGSVFEGKALPALRDCAAPRVRRRFEVPICLTQLDRRILSDQSLGDINSKFATWEQFPSRARLLARLEHY
jgi:hypothetical protein